MNTKQVASTLQLMRILWPSALALQAIRVAAILGVADLLADGPRSVDELADATRTHASSLGRLLRALTSLGVFVEDDTGRFAQTPLSDALRASHPQSIKRRAIMAGADFLWRPSGELEAAVRTGRTGFEHVFGLPFFEYVAEHADMSAAFDAGVSALPAATATVVAAYDFSQFDRVVDVGGGNGTLLTAILAAHSTLRGVLYDLPSAVADVVPAPESVAERMEIVGGDFFDSVPTGADAYILSRVVHNWSDEAAARILGGCRTAMRPGGCVLLLESVLTPGGDPAHAFMDVLMMVLTGGRERTEPEFRAVLAEAGLSLSRVIPTAGLCILECHPR